MTGGVGNNAVAALWSRSGKIRKRSMVMKKGLVLLLAVLLTGVAALGAQEGPPPPPDGLTFSGSVITGVRWRSNQPNDSGEWGGLFDINAEDDFLVNGDTAALRAVYDRGTYGGSFGLALNANNTQDNFWTADRIYVSEANLWAKVLDSKLGIKAGYFADFDYFSPVDAWSLFSGNAVQLTAYPIPGLQFDVRARTQPFRYMYFADGWNPAVWYENEEFGRNIDAGVRYSNPDFTVWVALDDDYTETAALFGRSNNFQLDVFGYFAYTGIPKLTVGVETKFLDLLSERKNLTDLSKTIGITNVTAINASYQITDAFSARIWLVAGADHFGFGNTARPILGDDGFDGITVAADVELGYKLNDALSFSLRPVFQVPDTEDFSIFNLSVKPKVTWTLAPFPYGATINFWYKLKVLGEGDAAYANNNNEALHHTLNLTFGWTF
jgi:hypothetical protein